MFRLDSFPLMQKILSVFSDHIKQSDSSAFTFFCYYDISSIVACQYKRPPTPASVCASSIPPSLPLKHLLTFLMFSLRLHIFSHCSPFHCLIKAIYICNIITYHPLPATALMHPKVFCLYLFWSLRTHPDILLQP